MKKYIESNPKILGGTPVIVGTRIPISRILFLLKEGYTLETIQQDYPYVDLKTLGKAVDDAIEFVSNPQNASIS
jgi:uncharacterized protein (DUF433 family)